MLVLGRIILEICWDYDSSCAFTSYHSSQNRLQHADAAWAIALLRHVRPRTSNCSASSFPSSSTPSLAPLCPRHPCPAHRCAHYPATSPRLQMTRQLTRSPALSYLVCFVHQTPPMWATHINGGFDLDGLRFGGRQRCQQPRLRIGIPSSVSCFTYAPSRPSSSSRSSDTLCTMRALITGASFSRPFSSSLDSHFSAS